MNSELSQGQAVTIQTYERNFQKYLDRTVSKVDDEYKEWIDKVLSFIDKDSEIFEVGSGTGRDADYIENLGYSINRSDVTLSFIEYQKNLGKKILKFDLLNDIFSKKYDLILANAVLLHFNLSELLKALKNIKSGMNNNGLFVFTTKNGIGEEYSSEKMDELRYFKYWQLDDLRNILIENGFDTEILKLSSDSKWILGIVKLAQ